MRFLHLVRPVMVVLPEVAQPDRKIPFREKVRHDIDETRQDTDETRHDTDETPTRH